jgi:hypothetical protein
MTPTKLPDFRAFCQQRFHLAHKAATVRDSRGQVDIPPSTVFSAVFLMGTMGWGSLLISRMAEATAAPIFVRNGRFRVRLWGDVPLMSFGLTDV